MITPIIYCRHQVFIVEWRSHPPIDVISFLLYSYISDIPTGCTHKHVSVAPKFEHN